MDTEVVGADDVIDMLNSMPEHLFQQAKREIQKSTFEAQSRITLPLSIGRYGLQNRSSNLSKSIQTSVTGTKLSTLRGSVFTKSIYAPIHEVGGTVNAKNAYLFLEGGPYLNIPSSENQTPERRLTRLTATEVFNQGGYIVKINAPRAEYMLALNGVAMFWLVKSVELKARLRMVSTATEEIPTLLSNLNKVMLDGLED